MDTIIQPFMYKIHIIFAILFQKLIVPFLKWESKNRVKEIVKSNNLLFDSFDLLLFLIH